MPRSGLARAIRNPGGRRSSTIRACPWTYTLPLTGAGQQHRARGDRVAGEGLQPGLVPVQDDPLLGDLFYVYGLELVRLDELGSPGRR